MWVILESFSEDGNLDENPLWESTLELLRRDIQIHFGTLWHWSCVGESEESALVDDSWFLQTPFLRPILKEYAKHILAPEEFIKLEAFI